jgi:outer membrane murein-binding lipoprotein Lpp
MKRFAVCILGCLVLTGCSELQVIGRATVRELSADAISVEKDRYRLRPARQTKVAETRTQVAKVDQASLPDARQGDATHKELWRH